MDPRRHIDPQSKELAYNPKYEELYAPVQGPENPFKTNQQKAHKNMLSGYVEKAHMNEFIFENQRRTFQSFGKFVLVIYGLSSDWNLFISGMVMYDVGYAMDPSLGGQVVGSAPKEVGPGGEIKTVFENTKQRPKDKRKRERNDDPEDVEGFLGPWGKFVDEQTVSKPTEVIK